MSRKRSHEYSISTSDDEDEEPVMMVDSVVGLQLKSVNSELKVLNEQQEAVLQRALKGVNVFYTGAAGTGKSLLTSRIVAGLRKQKKLYGKGTKEVWIAATTGLAATNIGGLTIHRHCGISSFERDLDKIIKNIPKSYKEKYTKVDAIVIDEVSMLSESIMVKLDLICRRFRSSVARMVGWPADVVKKNFMKPFGGIQIICTGDFFQLPPVLKGQPLKYVFETEIWEKTFRTNVFALNMIYRQRDAAFVNVLNKLRVGTMDLEMINFIEDISQRQCDMDDDWIFLFAKNDDVDRHNSVKQGELVERIMQTENKFKGDVVHTYYAEDNVPAGLKMLETSVSGIPKLDLCIGSRVLCVANVDQESGIVNGVRGQVIKFVESEYDIVMEKDIIFPAPLPLVRFTLPDGSTTDYLVRQYSFKTEVFEYEKVHTLERKQVPLVLAWAITIHKSQGMSIKKLVVDLKNIFTPGQMYVALSRAISAETLRVRNFSPRCAVSSPVVKAFYEKLDSQMKKLLNR